MPSSVLMMNRIQVTKEHRMGLCEFRQRVLPYARQGLWIEFNANEIEQSRESNSQCQVGSDNPKSEPTKSSDSVKLVQHLKSKPGKSPQFFFFRESVMNPNFKILANAFMEKTGNVQRLCSCPEFLGCNHVFLFYGGC